ncbi:MAG: SGNH/GDSL hydrolase family protein [Chitinophagales bacterium]|nr:SGNH/GDSL hydrolase family protein [Chitinophagales bacterium]
MNRRFGNTLLQFLIGFTVFLAIMLVINFYDLLIIDLFSLETKTFLQEVKNYPYNTFRELYPKYYFFVFLTIQLSKYFIYVAVLLLSLSLLLLYKKRINKEIIFKVYLLTASLFLIEISFSFINVNRLLNIEYRGKLITQDLEIRPKYRADEKGINTMLPESIYLREGYIVNKQGFRSNYTFTTTYIDSLKQLGKVIMFVGDSHTEGMWAEPIDSSFVDLIDQREDAFSLNFGISGTDPLQYKLIAQKYLLKIKPDMVILNFFMGNDIQYYKRILEPFHPVYYDTNAGNIMAFQNGIEYHTAETAYNNVLKQMYLIPTNFNQKIVAKSSVLTQVWKVGVKLGFSSCSNSVPHAEPLKSPACNEEIEQIIQICKENNSKFELIVIPDYLYAKTKVEEFPHLFENIDYVYSPIPKKYYNMNDGHFNDIGHEEYALFLDSIISLN